MTDKSLPEAAQMALETLRRLFPRLPEEELERVDHVCSVLRASLALPEAEPVAGTAFMRQFLSDVHTAAGLVEHGKQSKALGERLAHSCMVLFASPPATPVERKPLSEDVILEIGLSVGNHVDAYDDGLEFARAIEAAHGIRGES